MAIDKNRVAWAVNRILDPVSNQYNRENPPQEVKDSGINRNEPFARQWINDILHSHGDALGDLQDQITNADVGAGLISYDTVQDMIDFFGESTQTKCVTYAYNRPVISFWERVPSGAGDMSDGTIQLANNTYAKIQILPEMDVRAFGAWGDYDPVTMPPTRVNDVYIGYAHDDTQAFKNALANCSRVSCTEGDKFAITDHVAVDSSKVIDGHKAGFYWFGSSDAIRQVGRDRGMFEIVGTIGSQFQTSGVWASWKEGAEVFPADDTSTILSKEFIILSVGNIPNGPAEAYMVKPKEVDVFGSDPATRFQTDYRLGWTHENATFRYLDITPVRDVELNLGYVEDMTRYEYDEEDGSGNRRPASAVVMEAAYKCTVNIAESNQFMYPTVMTYYTTDCTVKNTRLLPSDRDSLGIGGWGIVVQWNNALRPLSYNLSAQGNRRVLDYTMAAYGYAQNIGGESTRDGELTTHGSYEHNLYYENTRGFMSFANSGQEFGESSKDITVVHHHGSDIFTVTNTINLHLIDCRCDSIRVNSVGLVMDNCSLFDLGIDATNNLCQINNWSARIGKPIDDRKRDAVINNSSLKSNGLVFLVDQDIGADDLITFNTCDLLLRQGDFAGEANIVINGGTLGGGFLVLVENPTSVEINNARGKNIAFGVLQAATRRINLTINGGKYVGENFLSSFWANQDSGSLQGHKVKIRGAEIEWDNVSSSGVFYDPLGTRNPNWYTEVTGCEITGTGASPSILRLPYQRSVTRFGGNTLINIDEQTDFGDPSSPATRIEYNNIRP